ncbi:glyoxalase [Streptomyces cinnamoneus]|uniref:Glyoxalase n=1 Tax=Streptomyces cinnamoneus TaxID=53446 RepID=A0A2G1XJD3_STRCJ|nr:VOC family protein [Streptomyces cinnamoneus]PHQ51291.1 glyoxalase [Streptomyces cinnamoneus]PPT13483.1 VOC family protein [Streptomyces cinnamoneus]
MPEVTKPYVPGTPCWVDLVVPDQREALDFYRDLFGWQGEPGPPETGGYAVCALNGKAVAGIMTSMAQEGGSKPPPAWTTYLAVADADAAVAAVNANGGTPLTDVMDVLTLGRMAVVADSTGAVFGLWQAGDFFGAQVVNEPGSVVWNELNTADPGTAGSFYSAALGLTHSPMEELPGYSALKANGRVVGGMQSLEKSPPGSPSHWLTYFCVDDTDGTVDALTKAGGSVLKPPFDMVAGRMAVVQDPQGAVFALIDATGPSPEAG